MSWQPPGVRNKPNAAGVINDEYFDVRIFDDGDNELPRNADGEIVVRPKRPHIMFEGYWGRPEATVDASRNWWFHTGDIGRIDDDGFLYFVDRKADYLRRRGENISSFEVESVLMSHGARRRGRARGAERDDRGRPQDHGDAEGRRAVTEEELFRWCIDQLPYFALPRYIEFRAELPPQPGGASAQAHVARRRGDRDDVGRGCRRHHLRQALSRRVPFADAHGRGSRSMTAFAQL